MTRKPVQHCSTLFSLFWASIRNSSQWTHSLHKTFFGRKKKHSIVIACSDLTCNFIFLDNHAKFNRKSPNKSPLAQNEDAYIAQDYISQQLQLNSESKRPWAWPCSALHTSQASGHVFLERLWKLNQDKKVLRSGCPAALGTHKESYYEELWGKPALA